MSNPIKLCARERRRHSANKAAPVTMPARRSSTPILLVTGLLLLAMTGCAAHYTPDAYADPYGLFSGIWHGFVSPFALAACVVSWLCSLLGVSFLDSIAIIGRPNTGLWYYAGFFLGICLYGSAA